MLMGDTETRIILYRDRSDTPVAQALHKLISTTYRNRAKNGEDMQLSA